MSLFWEEIKTLNFSNYSKENIDPQHFFEKMSYQSLYSELFTDSSSVTTPMTSSSSSFDDLNKSFSSAQPPVLLSRSHSMNIDKSERNEKLYLSHYMRTPSAEPGHNNCSGVLADKTQDSINVINFRERKSEQNFVSLENIPQAMKKPISLKKKQIKLKMHLDEFYQTPFDEKLKERFSDCFHSKENQQMPAPIKFY